MTKPPPTAKVIPLTVPVKDKRRAEAKYGKAVMSHGFTVVPKTRRGVGRPTS